MQKPKRSGEIMFFVIWVLIIVMLVMIKLFFFGDRTEVGKSMVNNHAPLVSSICQTGQTDAFLSENFSNSFKIQYHERDQ